MSETPCEHAMQIADALARHDFPGMPSLDELDTAAQEAYIQMGEDALLRMPDLGSVASDMIEPDAWRDHDPRGIGEA